MRAVSPETRTNLERLRDLATPARRWRPSKRDGEGIRAAAQAILASGDWRAIPHLAPLVVAGHERVAQASLQLLAELVPRVPIRRVAQLDRRMREGSAIWADMTWLKVANEDLERIARQAHGQAFLQMAMCHPSGYVREAAIRLANLRSNGGDIRFLLIRLNDWVPPVQRAAAEALRARFTAHSADDLVAALPVLDEGSEAQGRRRSRSAADEVETFLHSEAAAPAVRRGLHHADSAVRRSAYGRALAATSLQRADVLRSALRDRDPFIRLWATRHIDPTDPAAFGTVLEAMLRDSLGIIRLRSLELALEHRRDADLESFLTDFHAGVRSLAQATLLARDVDVVALYRRTITSAHGRRLAAALSGLAESAGAAAEPQIRPFLVDPSSAVRRAVLHAMSALESDAIVEACLGALEDSAPQVAHAARDLLVRRVSRIPREGVWTIAARTRQPHTRLDAIAILSHLDYWVRLPYLLRATHLEHGKDRAVRHLMKWVATRSRRFNRPDRDVEAAIRTALHDADIEQHLRDTIAAMVPRSS